MSTKLPAGFSSDGVSSIVNCSCLLCKWKTILRLKANDLLICEIILNLVSAFFC